MTTQQSKKTLVAIVLLTLLVANASAATTFLVHADAGGVGKYLTINIIGGEGCNVTATKSSGEVWLYSYPGRTNKVGAGTVQLHAVPAAGWEFAGWDSGLGTADTVSIKTDKYQVITATFIRKTYTLTVNYAGTGTGSVTKNPDKTVYYYGDVVTLTAVPDVSSDFKGWSQDLSGTGNPAQITIDANKLVTATFDLKHFTITASAGENGVISPEGATDVLYGHDQTFTFAANEGFHVSAIVIDGTYLATFGTSYTFSDVTEDHSIAVAFSELGKADVPVGDGVAVFLDAGAGLTFGDGVTSGGTATGFTGLPIGSFIVVWDIETDAGFNGNVTVVLQYDDTGLTLEEEAALKLYRTDSNADVNWDGKIDGADVSIVANANPSVPGSVNWNALLDLNHDGKIDDLDVNIVNDHIGETSVFEDITISVDTVNNLIYGETSGFSIFGVR